MKKVFFLMVFVMCIITAKAETYRVKYDVNNQCNTSFVVTLSTNKVTIGQRTYSLHQLGTITNSGLIFNSYCYGTKDAMFCVSTTSITVEKDFFTKLFGYIIIIDSKAYLADKVN